jgi:Mce-associated membrane protein
MADEPDTPDAEEQVSESTQADVEGRDEHDDHDEVDKTAETDETAEVDPTDKADKADEVDEVDEVDGEEPQSTQRRSRRRLSSVGWALVAGGVVVAALAGLAGWYGYRAYEKHAAQAQRDLFVQTARQGAVNLTTINYIEVEADVQRVLDSATGAFREDFAKRAQPFIEIVKAARSQSEGTITEAGLESQRGDSAQVLVAVAVKSRTAVGEQAPRQWRMKIEVQAVGDGAKVSNVVFVP